MSSRWSLVHFLGAPITHSSWMPSSEASISNVAFLAIASLDSRKSTLEFWSVQQSSDGGFDTTDGSPLSMLGQMSLPNNVSTLKGLPTRSRSSTGALSRLLVGLDDGAMKVLEAKMTHGGFECGEVHEFVDVRSDGRRDKAPVSTVDVYHDDVVVGREDGTMSYMNLETLKQSASERISSWPINGVHLAGGTTIVAVSSNGDINVVDTRDSPSRLQQRFSLSAEDKKTVSIHCSSMHPDQKNVLVTGANDGTLYMWDMRNPSLPIHKHNHHKSNIWGVQFHPTSPNALFTCSGDGTVLLWDFDASRDVMRGAFDGTGRDLKVHTVCENVCGIACVDMLAELNMLAACTHSESVILRAGLAL